MNDQPLPVIPSAQELLEHLKEITDQHPNYYCCLSLTVTKFTSSPTPSFKFRAYAEPLGHSKEFATVGEAVRDLLGDSRAKLEAQRDALRKQLSATEAMLAVSPAIANPLPL